MAGPDPRPRAAVGLPPAPARVAGGIVSVRGPLLTLRLEGFAWVIRSGPDPRAWRKPVDRHGHGTGPWEPARLVARDDLLRPPQAFPPAADALLADFRAWREANRQHHDDRMRQLGRPPQHGTSQGAPAFPWAERPGPGERLRRRQLPARPDDPVWRGFEHPSARAWFRVPEGMGPWHEPHLPPVLESRHHGRLRTTIRAVTLLRQSLPDWAALFPRDAIAFLERHRFSSRRWHLLNLWIRVPEARERWDDLPALAWLAANSWFVKQRPVQRPFRSLRALARRPLAALLRWLDLPSGKGTVLLLRSVDPATLSPETACAICRILRDEDRRRHWLALPRPATDRLLRRLGSRCPPSFPLLLAMNLRQRLGTGHRPTVESVFGDCLRLIRALGAEDRYRPILARIRSPERLLRLHDELVRELNLRPLAALWTEPIQPPLPPASWMRPLTVPEDLRREGSDMVHCIASYARAIIRRAYYAYAIDHPVHGRATLGLAWVRGSRWAIAELSGKKNDPVPAALRAAVEVWFGEAAFSGEPPETGDGPTQVIPADGNLPF